MKKLSNSKMISILFILLILVVIAKSLSLLLWWYLPNDGIELSIKNNYQPKYQRVYCKNIIIKPNIEQKKEASVAPSDGISITNMILKGLYGTSKQAFVIVAMRDTPKKTQLIALEEIFKGYKLKSITQNSAIFEKNSKDYILTLEPIGNKKESKFGRRERKYVTPAYYTDEPPVGVSRSDIAHYAKNPKQIWRDISIKEVKDGKKIVGFKVTKIKRNSKFAQLGLQRGDLIIKANNVRLKSYKDALDIYNKIDKLDMIQIVVMRDNQEVELVYEIN